MSCSMRAARAGLRIFSSTGSIGGLERDWLPWKQDAGPLSVALPDLRHSPGRDAVRPLGESSAGLKRGGAHGEDRPRRDGEDFDARPELLRYHRRVDR